MDNSINYPNKPQPKIETKTSPFSLPRSTTSSIQQKKVRKVNLGIKGENTFNILIGIFIIVVVGMLSYSAYTLIQLQNNQSAVNTTTNTIQVSDETPITDSNTWSSREIKINNNVVWKMLLPTNFVEINPNSNDGTNTLTGTIDGDSYTIVFSFPLFQNYPNGIPQYLDTWVNTELSFLDSAAAAKVTTEVFTLDQNVDAKELIGIPKVTKDNGDTREFDTTKTAVMYIWKTKSRNPSQIVLIPSGAYDEEKLKTNMQRIASSLTF